MPRWQYLWHIVKRKYRSLAEYLDQTGTPQFVLAKLLGVDQGYVSRLVSGKRTPALPVAIRIVRLTGVPYESLVAKPERAAA